MMDIVLADINGGMCEAWEEAIKDFALDDIEVYHGSIFDIEVEGLVSPANSFGFMDGGLDLLISRFFGWKVQDRVQQRIKVEHNGELLVGDALIVQTDHRKIPHVISAPTMRVPMILKNSINPYLATKAAIYKSLRRPLKSISIPGMGTGVGRVPFDVCANQMCVAISDVRDGNYEFPKSWFEAAGRQQVLCGKEPVDL